VHRTLLRRRRSRLIARNATQSSVEVFNALINHAPPVLDEIYDRYDRLEEKSDALAKYEAFMVRLLA
jgi:hypothetical protein